MAKQALALKKHPILDMRAQDDLLSFALRRWTEQDRLAGLQFARTLVEIKNASDALQNAVSAVGTADYTASKHTGLGKCCRDLSSVLEDLKLQQCALLGALLAAIFPDEKETAEQSIKRLSEWGKPAEAVAHAS